MLHSTSSSVTLTVLTITLNLLLSSSLIPTIAAQDFRPRPNSETCNAYAEGQGLYVFGGSTKENFMLDLSVSWNTSDPVFRRIPGGPSVDKGICAMTNNGGDLFVMTKGTGYVYNVKSSSWSVFQNPNFGTTATWQVSATDPETGFIYLPTYGMDFQGANVFVSVDLKSNTVNTTAVGVDPKWVQHATWSAYLRSMIMLFQHYAPYTFTPSKVNKTSNGWDNLQLKVVGSETRGGYIASLWSCGAPAYNGTKLIHMGSYKDTYVYIMDVVKRTWRRGPPPPLPIDKSACAVTGDQFIVWGGHTYGEIDPVTLITPKTPSNRTFVFDMKIEKWVSRYTAPPLPTTTTYTSQPTQTQEQHTPYTTATPESGNASSSDMKLVTIIVIVTGILMAIILGIILRYHRRTSQFNSDCQRTSPDGSSTDSLNTRDGLKTSVKELSLASSRRRDPSDSGSDSVDRHGQRKWYMNGLLGRIHQGPLGARPLSEHPHTIVEDPTTKRNVQEGALEVQTLSQHPHAVVGETFNSNHDGKAMRGYIGGYGDKEELEDQ